MKVLPLLLALMWTTTAHAELILEIRSSGPISPTATTATIDVYATPVSSPISITEFHLKFSLRAPGETGLPNGISIPTHGFVTRPIFTYDAPFGGQSGEVSDWSPDLSPEEREVADFYIGGEGGVDTNSTPQFAIITGLTRLFSLNFNIAADFERGTNLPINFTVGMPPVGLNGVFSGTTPIAITEYRNGSLTFSAVPEPSSGLLCLLAAAGSRLFLRRRRSAMLNRARASALL